MTEINVSSKTPINQSTHQVRLNDVGRPQISGRSAGPAAWCSEHTETQLCATKRAPNVQTAFGIYGPSYTYFFSASPRRNIKDKIHAGEVTV